jgi:tetratricopeptide (TPR) repeat protein
MSEEKDKPFSEGETYEIVRRYEEMLRNNTSYYFDVDEFEDIIDYYVDSNKFSVAFDVVQYASVQHPSSTGILLRKAQLLIDKGQPLEAIRILKDVSRIEPANPDLYVAQGFAYNQIGDFKSAIRQFDHGLTLVIEGKPDVLYNIAVSFEQANQYKTAMKYLHMANEMEPDNISVIYDLAYCCERLEMLEKSVEYYKKYLDLDPYSENVWYNLGVVYNRMDSFKMAIEAYDYAIAIDETYSSAYYNKANTLANINEYQKAIDVYKEFMYLEEDNDQVLCYIGECYEKIGQFEEALVYYRKVIKKNEKFADAWLGIGLVMYEKKMYYESLYYVRRAIQLEGDNQDSWFALGNVYTKLEFFDDAIISYKKAIELDPYDFESWVNMADLYYMEKQLIKALQTLEEGLGYNHDSAIILCRMSVYYFLLSNFDLGKEMLQKSLKADPSMAIEFENYYPGETPDSINKIIQNYHP